MWTKIVKCKVLKDTSIAASFTFSFHYTGDKARAGQHNADIFSRETSANRRKTTATVRVCCKKKDLGWGVLSRNVININLKSST